jgi:cytochrome c oxidase assembly protein subunit 15
MPPMVGGIFYEHGHRMVATFVGILTVILVVSIYRFEKRSWLRKLSLVALLAVILQGVLGGLTVLFLLPTWISVSHATLAQTFFCIVASIALFESSWWQNGRPATVRQASSASLFKFGIVAVGAVYVQLILGALMRHTGSGLAVPDFPLAYGQFLPSLSTEALQKYNADLILKNIRLAADGPISAGQITIHMAHRMWALVAGSLVVIYGYRLYRHSKGVNQLALPGIVLMMLVPVQITLGALTVLSGKAVAITTMHVAGGALILMTAVVSTLMLYRILPHTAANSVPALGLQEAKA